MKLGPINVEKPIALAPMEDVTDAAFRITCKKLGADLVYTEFTSSEAVIRNIPRAMRKIKVYEEERPVAIQLFGGKETSMEEAAAKAAALGPDFIDINCGCWVKNHVARGEGAALLKDLPRFEKIVRSTVRGTSLPVTVKTRLGWDESSIVILDVAKMVEQAGAKALTVHCRTRSQGHANSADWTWLEKIKKVISIPLLGNGDINSPQEVKRMFETGVDGVMVGRGAISNPWIFKQAKHYMATGILLPEPSLEEKINVCIEHLKLSMKLKDSKNVILSFRKHYAGYFRGIPNVSHLRSDLMKLVDLDSVVSRLKLFIEQSKEENYQYSSV